MISEVTDFLYRGYIFGACGIALEVVFTSVQSRLRIGGSQFEGCSTAWMLPCYGLGGLLFDYLRRAAGTEAAWMIPCYLVLIYVFEAGYGAFLKKVVGVIPWEYKTGWHWKGLVRWDYAPFWFLVAVSFNPLARHLQ